MSKKILRSLESFLGKDNKLLAKQAKLFAGNVELYNNFINKVDHWYGKNEKRYLHFMSTFGRDFINELEFKTALRGLYAPFNDLEVYLLYRLLDPNENGYVEYSKLFEAIWRALASKLLLEDARRVLNLDGPNRWIQMTFKVPTLDSFELPTTFEELVDVDYTGEMIRQMIQIKVPNLLTRHIVLFTDPLRPADTIFHCFQHLRDLNYNGGPKVSPTEGVMYYEFSMGHIDCPLLFGFVPHKRTMINLEDLRKIDRVNNVFN